MPLELVRNDIVRMQVDAVVNAANARLQRGGGVCGAIFAAADGKKLQAACDRIGFCAVGDAVMTHSYGLPAPYVIHAVGPVWQGGEHDEERLLRSCYTRALELARKKRLSSVAFPLISSGIFGVPRERAMAAALQAIGEFLMREDMTVYLVLYDHSACMLGEKLYAEVRAYIDERYVDEHQTLRRTRPQELSWQLEAPTYAADAVREDADAECPDDWPKPAPQAAQPAVSLQELLRRRQSESFSEMLLRLIDERGLSDPQVYKRANLDRKLFSKIRGNRDYQPGKNTALALAVALQLSITETAELLRRAGYALSPGSRADLIVEYFISRGNYNIHEINEALFEFDQKLLGAH